MVSYRLRVFVLATFTGLAGACSNGAGLGGIAGTKKDDKSPSSNVSKDSALAPEDESMPADTPTQVSGAFLVDCAPAPSLSPDLPTLVAGEQAIGCVVLDSTTKLKTAAAVTGLRVTLRFADGTTRTVDAEPATGEDSPYNGYLVLPASMWDAVADYTAEASIAGEPTTIGAGSQGPKPAVDPQAPGTSAQAAPTPEAKFVARMFLDALGREATVNEIGVYGQRIGAARAANDMVALEKTIFEITSSGEALRFQARKWIEVFWGPNMATPEEVERVVLDHNKNYTPRVPADTITVIAADDKAVALAQGQEPLYQNLLWKQILGRAPTDTEASEVVPVGVREDRIQRILDLIARPDAMRQSWATQYVTLLHRTADIGVLRESPDVAAWVNKSTTAGLRYNAARFPAWVMKGPEYWGLATQ